MLVKALVEKLVKAGEDKLEEKAGVKLVEVRDIARQWCFVTSDLEYCESKIYCKFMWTVVIPVNKSSAKFVVKF